METQENDAEQEFLAIKAVHEALAKLNIEGQARVIRYVSSLLAIEKQPTEDGARSGFSSSETPQYSRVDDATIATAEYNSMAELYDATSPVTHADKALIAGYWLQVHEGVEGFDSQSANTALKHLGHGLPNVTAALTKLKSLKPALVIQVKKSGTSQQARKTYRVTTAGEREVKTMIKNIST